MLRASLALLLVGVLALCWADISVTTIDPWHELKLMAIGLLTPQPAYPQEIIKALFNTVSFALIGICLAVFFGSILAQFFEVLPIRIFCSFIRSVHELFWAFIFMPLIGLNAVCGILAIAVPYSGIFAKVYAEIVQESDSRPSDALPPHTPRLSGLLYITLPIVYQDLKNYTSYRFECALRSSAILGFIGLPTLGYHLETAFREGLYSQASALLYCFYLLIISLRLWAKPKFIVIPILLSILLLNWDTSLSLSNISRFMTYDILPWPMRAEGFYNATHAIHFNLHEILVWLSDLLKNEALPGLWNTFLLTQIAMVCSGIFALLFFPPASRHILGTAGTRVSHLALVILRTTPEYILAYLFLQLWGPSMLPAIWALFLHNGAILAYLSARSSDLLELPLDASNRKINRYLFEILPKIYGRFLAFLFYRWEVIMRESAILGILGIHTLGFYIDSAITLDQLDKALILILVTALCNMVIDTASQLIRRRLKISFNLAASR